MGAGGWKITLPVAIMMVVVLDTPAHAHPKTDIVALANGDRITGEVSTLNRGRLEFKTDDEGTIYFRVGQDRDRGCSHEWRVMG